MVDHFHGTDDWEHFMAGMRQVLPDAQSRISRMPTRSTTSYTTSTKSFRSPASSTSPRGITYEKDGYVPKWRAIRNEHGRIMVAICAQHASRRRLGACR